MRGSIGDDLAGELLWSYVFLVLRVVVTMLREIIKDEDTIKSFLFFMREGSLGGCVVGRA